MDVKTVTIGGLMLAIVAGVPSVSGIDHARAGESFGVQDVFEGGLADFVAVALELKIDHFVHRKNGEGDETAQSCDYRFRVVER
ncbi:MAG: hypothetical protein HKN27_04480, partial [Silicimonas sp.]|nr:hypothetical protein [Silicimonas sp.]